MILQLNQQNIKKKQKIQKNKYYKLKANRKIKLNKNTKSIKTNTKDYKINSMKS